MTTQSPETMNQNGQSNGTAQPAQPKTNALAVQPPAPVGDGAIDAFASAANFATAQRIATGLSQSTMVPAIYQNNVPNCLIALELAARLKMSVLAVMQECQPIHGKPTWSAKSLIAAVNASGRFTPLRFKFEGQPGTDSWGCRAIARDKDTDEPLIGPLVTIAMAKAEGWYQKNGSKWKTMPEVMLHYRSATLWSRIYDPGSSLGMTTHDEVFDTTGYTVQEVATPAPVAGSVQDLEARILAQSPPAPVADAQPAEDSQRGTTVEPTPEPPKRTRKAASEQEVLVQDEPGADG